MGWGQVGQHRASGHQGGLGVTGMLKHHYSSMLKYDPKHYGHDATKPPKPNVTKRWASIRDVDDLFVKYGTASSSEAASARNIIDLTAVGYEKLLGGGTVRGAYLVIIPKISASAAAKIKAAGGEVLPADGR